MWQNEWARQVGKQHTHHPLLGLDHLHQDGQAHCTRQHHYTAVAKPQPLVLLEIPAHIASEKYPDTHARTHARTHESIVSGADYPYARLLAGSLAGAH